MRFERTGTSCSMHSAMSMCWLASRQSSSRKSRDRDFLLELWREASQHIDIAECIEQLVPVLSKRIPLDAILVRRLDDAAAALDTVAAARIRGSSIASPQRTDLLPEDLDALEHWIRKG